MTTTSQETAKKTANTSDLSLGVHSRRVIGRMEHMHVSVSDIDASIAWYRNVLGFEVRWSGTGMSGQRCAHVGTDRFYIAMSEHPENLEEPATGRFFHSGFTCEVSRDEFLERLEASGVEPESTANRPEGWAIYIQDPDGHEMEIVGYRPDYVYA